MAAAAEVGPGWVYDFELGADVCCGAFRDHEVYVQHGLHRRANHCVWRVALRTKEKMPPQAFLQTLVYRALRVQTAKDPYRAFAVQPGGENWLTFAQWFAAALLTEATLRKDLSQYGGRYMLALELVARAPGGRLGSIWV